MAGLLRLIEDGDALKPASRSLLLDMMSRCRTGSNRIRGLLPPGTRVENKTGTLAGYTGDVGFLTLPDGRRIAVAFFARGGANRAGVIATARSEEHTSELQSLMRTSYAAFCLKKNKLKRNSNRRHTK